MAESKLTRFRLKNVEKVKLLVSRVGTFKVATMTDEQAERLYNYEPEGRYVEKVEDPVPESEPQPKKAAPKK